MRIHLVVVLRPCHRRQTTCNQFQVNLPRRKAICISISTFLEDSKDSIRKKVSLNGNREFCMQRSWLPLRKLACATWPLRSLFLSRQVPIMLHNLWQALPLPLACQWTMVGCIRRWCYSDKHNTHQLAPADTTFQELWKTQGKKPTSCWVRQWQWLWWTLVLFYQMYAVL